uniref:Uncharacterized protein n=1 Tax=Anguilla anguilla TaxID=7936 RepID=A0A0E9V1Z1_ANGAN
MQMSYCKMTPLMQWRKRKQKVCKRRKDCAEEGVLTHE